MIWFTKKRRLSFKPIAERFAVPFRFAGTSRGITLMELLVVLAILALVATVAVPLYLKHLSNSRIQTAGIQIDRLGGILDLYKFGVGRYPAEDEGLEAMLTQPPGVVRWDGPYLKNRDALTDPWGQPYIYRFPGEHGPYDLFSLGGDGAEGGEGEDADITSW
jgi:general secretion pathway protein G